MKKYMGLLTFILVVLPSCIEKKQTVVESARLDLLPKMTQATFVS